MPPSPNAPGRLIAIEGIDGAGKTTQAQRLQRWLAARGADCVLLKEPTYGPHGQELRRLAAAGRDAITPLREFELFLEDRRENVRASIRPALERGATVLLDRYYISSMAYQGARGLDPAEIRRANEAFAPVPDLILLFELPIEEALRRIRLREEEGPNLFEREHHLRAVDAILRRLEGFPRIVSIDAEREPDAVFESVIAAMG